MPVRVSYGGVFVSTANDWNLGFATDLICATNEDLCRILEHGTKAEAGFFGPEAIGCTLQISLGCGILPRHSALILIDLIAYTFQLPTLCRWSRSPKFEDSHCAFHHCPLWSEWGCSTDNQINLPASLARATCSRMKAPFGIYAIELMKLTDGVDKILTDGKVINTGPLWMESFLILVHHFTLIHPRVQAASGSVEVGQGQNILIIN